MSNYATRESRRDFKFIQKRDSREPQNTFDFISTCDDIEASKKSRKKDFSAIFFFFQNLFSDLQTGSILVLSTINAN